MNGVDADMEKQKRNFFFKRNIICRMCVFLLILGFLCNRVAFCCTIEN